MKLRSIIFFCWIIVNLFLGIASVLAQEENIFPMAQGNYWIYKGKVQWAVPGTNEVKEKELEWKMEMTEVLQRDFIRVAVLKGHPQDLAWYEEGKERGDYLLIAIHDKYYLLSGERAQQAIKRLKDEKDALVGLLSGADLILDTPLRGGKVFGEMDGLTRSDLMYVWVVENESQAALEGVKGINDDKRRISYLVTYRCLPEHFFIDYVLGVGITHYIYSHHGTVSDVDVRLIECSVITDLRKKNVLEFFLQRLLAEVSTDYRRLFSRVTKGDFF